MGNVYTNPKRKRIKQFLDNCAKQSLHSLNSGNKECNETLRNSSLKSNRSKILFRMNRHRRNKR